MDVKVHVRRLLIAAGCGSRWAISACRMSFTGAAIGFDLLRLLVLRLRLLSPEACLCRLESPDKSPIFRFLPSLCPKMGRGLGRERERGSGWATSCDGITRELRPGFVGEIKSVGVDSSPILGSICGKYEIGYRDSQRKTYHFLILELSSDNIPMGLRFPQMLSIKKDQDIQRWL